MDARVYSALERLQESPPNGNPVSSWLDGRRDDVLVLVADVGSRIAAELVGVDPRQISSWLAANPKEGDRRKVPASRDTAPFSQRPLTQELARRFIRAKTAEGNRPKTIESYHYILLALTRAHPAALPLDPRAVRRLYHRGDISRGTRHKIFSVLQRFYRWAVRNGHVHVEQDPFRVLEAPAVESRPPRFLVIEQLAEVVRESRPPWERSLVMALVDTGALISELEGLSKDSIKGNSLHVGRGIRRERRVPLSPEVRGYLESLPTYYLFPKHREWNAKGSDMVDKPGTADVLQTRVRAVLRRVGIRPPGAGPQLLRDSFAAAYLSRGGDTTALCRILGHKDSRTAERYASLGLSDLRRRHTIASPWRGILEHMLPGEAPTPREHAGAPCVSLPTEVGDVPLEVEGEPVSPFLVRDRRPRHNYYYVRASRGRVPERTRWTVASLGTDLPASLVYAYRLAVAEENTRRWVP